MLNKRWYERWHSPNVDDVKGDPLATLDVLNGEVEPEPINLILDCIESKLNSANYESTP